MASYTFPITGNGKKYEEKSSPLPPTKFGGICFIKNLCMGEQTLLGAFMRGCLTWGLMIRSRKGEVNG